MVEQHIVCGASALRKFLAENDWQNDGVKSLGDGSSIDDEGSNVCVFAASQGDRVIHAWLVKTVGETLPTLAFFDTSEKVFKGNATVVGNDLSPTGEEPFIAEGIADVMVKGV